MSRHLPSSNDNGRYATVFQFTVVCRGFSCLRYRGKDTSSFDPFWLRTATSSLITVDPPQYPVPRAQDLWTYRSRSTLVGPPTHRFLVNSTNEFYTRKTVYIHYGFKLRIFSFYSVSQGPNLLEYQTILSFYVSLSKGTLHDSHQYLRTCCSSVSLFIPRVPSSSSLSLCVSWEPLSVLRSPFPVESHRPHQVRWQCGYFDETSSGDLGSLGRVEKKRN